ncbi:MAG: hypothetical protein K2H64_08370 [Desulfovibrio sp.]|nr:hypothetical protein [Desulfovibrio sp.]
MRFFYIHGFNGGWPSRSGLALGKLLDAGVFCLQYDYSKPFVECRDALWDAINSSRAKKICLMGTSLGGFYALSLRHPSIRKVVAWNPVVYPAVQLLQFVGENVRFNDGVAWRFEKSVALSYATAPDPRARIPSPGMDDNSSPPVRRVILGLDDEILDSELGAAYWAGYADLSFIKSGHSVEDYGHLLEIEPELATLRD